MIGSGWDGTWIGRARSGIKATAKGARCLVRPDLSEAFGQLRLRPRSWLGAVEDKFTAFGLAPASIIVENSSDYISEKLIDAVCAGVVPIYVGPSLSEFGFPSDIAIECAADPWAIAQEVAGLTPCRRQEVTAAGRRWLQSPVAAEHEIATVLANLGLEIGRRLA